MSNNKLPFNYLPIIKRPKLKLPNNAQIGIYIGLNIEHYELGNPGTSLFAGTNHLNPDPLNYGWRDYSTRIGIWRMMDLFDKYDVRPSCLLNSDVCTYYPEILIEGNKRKWVWLAHGKNNTIFQTNMEIKHEKSYLKDVVETIHNTTGKKIKGWLGPALTETFNTPEILSNLGLTYLLDWCNDDQPYPLNIKNKKMISIPYSVAINDISIFIGKNTCGNDYLQILIDNFDTLYDEGIDNPRIMTIGLHPFIMGQPFLIKYLENFLKYINSKKKVWFTTSDDIAKWYFDNYYDEVLKLVLNK